MGAYTTLTWSREKTKRYVRDALDEIPDNKLERLAEILLEDQLYNLNIGLDVNEFENVN